MFIIEGIYEIITYPLKVIKDAYYNVTQGIPNLIKWFPVIWSDRNWDFYFIWTLLHRKLYLMEKHIRQHSHHLYKERDADQIKICVNLLKRILDDEYYENVFKNHDKKWGKTHFNWKKIDGEEFGYKEEVCSLDITRENAKTDEEKAQQTKEFRILSTKVEEQKKQDINYLFDYMKKHIQGWWD